MKFQFIRKKRVLTFVFRQKNRNFAKSKFEYKIEKTVTMTLTKTQFETILLLYVANVDGQLHANELQLIMSKTAPDDYAQTKKMFDKMGDLEILDCIRENKNQLAATEADRQQLLDELKKMMFADNRKTSMEVRLYKSIENILCQE